jgi:hypothetical protein
VKVEDAVVGRRAVVRERVRQLLCSLVDGSGDVVAVCCELSHLRSGGAEWLPVTFEGIDSELEELPLPRTYDLWHPESLARKLAEMRPVLEECRELARREAEKILAEEFGEAGCARPGS